MIALRPTGAAVSPAALVALLGATMFGSAITITRRLRRTHWLVLTTWQFVGAGLDRRPRCRRSFDWVAPTPLDTSD